MKRRHSKFSRFLHKINPFRLIKKIRYSRFVRKLRSSLWVRRAIEIIGVEIAISLFASVLCYALFSNTYQSVFVTALAAALIYFVWTISCLYRFRLRVRGKGKYFLINGPLYRVFFIIIIVLAFINAEPAYTFLFMPFKVLHYAAKIWPFPGAGYMRRPVSAALMGLAFTVPVFFIPIVFSSKRKARVLHGHSWWRRKHKSKKPQEPTA